MPTTLQSVQPGRGREMARVVRQYVTVGCCMLWPGCRLEVRSLINRTGGGGSEREYGLLMGYYSVYAE